MIKKRENRTHAMLLQQSKTGWYKLVVKRYLLGFEIKKKSTLFKYEKDALERFSFFEKKHFIK